MLLSLAKFFTWILSIFFFIGFILGFIFRIFYSGFVNGYDWWQDAMEKDVIDKANKIIVEKNKYTGDDFDQNF